MEATLVALAFSFLTKSGGEKTQPPKRELGWELTTNQPNPNKANQNQAPPTKQAQTQTKQTTPKQNRQAKQKGQKGTMKDASLK